MPSKANIAIVSHSSSLEYPRIDCTKRHSLTDIVVVSICAVIAGAEGWEDIEAFARDKQDWLKRFLKRTNGIPSHDTISRVFRRLKPGQFNDCFASWTKLLQQELALKHIAIDGKTIRRSFDRVTAKNAFHLVSAWSTENHLALGQVVTAE